MRTPFALPTDLPLSIAMVAGEFCLSNKYCQPMMVQTALLNIQYLVCYSTHCAYRLYSTNATTRTSSMQHNTGTGIATDRPTPPPPADVDFGTPTDSQKNIMRKENYAAAEDMKKEKSSP